MLSDLPPSDMQSNPRAAHTQIPSEILEHIFADCVHSTSDAVGHDHTQCFRSNLEVPPWIAITYVCRRWRQISIGYKFLWTHIAGSFSAEWITIFLQRSAPVPLDVDLSLHSWSRQQDLLQLFQAEMHRVRNLYVRSRFTVSDAEPIHRQLDVFVSTFAGTPAPALTSLTIDIPPLRFYDMPSVLFNTNAPRLQRLSLSRGIYPTDPESRLYASLLHLQIDSEYTFAQLAALGTSMPLLQTAVIGSVKTGLLRMDEPGLVEPALTSLRRLHMRKWDAFVFGLPHLLRLAPNLEELRIQRCQRDTPHPPPPAPLHSQEPDLVVQHAAQSLKRLYMPLYALAQAEALLAIPFGPAIQLHLHLKSRDEGRDVYARLAGLLEGRLRYQLFSADGNGEGEEGVTRLAVQGSPYEDGLSLQCFRRPDYGSERGRHVHSKSKVHVQQAMPWNPDFDDPDAALRVSYTAHPDDSCLFGAQALCSVLPFAGVHTVSLAAFSRLRKAGISDSDIGGGGGETVNVDWMDVLRCMPGVRTLELVRYAVGDVLQDIADYARRMSLRPGSGSVDDRDWGVPLLKFALPAVERMVLVQPETDFCVAEDPKRVLGLLSLLLRGLGEPKSVPKSVTVDARETASSLEEIVLSRFVDLEESDVDDLRKHVRRVVIRG